MHQFKYHELLKSYSGNKDLILFWENLKPFYDYFEKEKQLPVIWVDGDGKYQMK
jgi:murein L,D-transpeptidase YafK